LSTQLGRYATLSLYQTLRSEMKGSGGFCGPARPQAGQQFIGDIGSVPFAE